MSNTNKVYLLYQNNSHFSTTEDLDYSINWLLINLLKNNMNVHIELKSYLHNQNESVLEGIIKFNTELNSIIKCIPYSSTFTIYSPYDTSLFYHTHNSNMYIELKNKQNKYVNQCIQVTEDNNELSQNTQVTQNTQVSKSQELKKIFSEIIETSDKLNNVSINLKNKQDNKETKETIEIIEDDSDNSSDNESVSSEDLDKIQEHLNKLLEEKVNVDNLIKEKDDELADLRCEESHQRQLKRKEKEKEEEKYNIFRSDINIYVRIINNFNKSKEESENKEEVKLENFIPPMFEAKFYVIKFLYDENLIEDSDYEEPSQELYELYNILYKSRFDENYDIPDDFEDIITKFIHHLPDKTILTENELHTQLNNQGKHDMLFIQHEEEENIINKDE